MNARIKTTQFEMTPEINEYLGKKIASLEHFFDSKDPATSWDIELERLKDGHNEGKPFRAEFNLHMKGEVYRAEATGATMLAALDDAKDELKQELRKKHSKTQRFLRESGRRAKDFLRGWSKN